MTPARLIARFVHDPRIFIRYVSVGASAALIEFLLFSILHEVMHWPLLVANCAALSVAVIYCFLMQKNWTFKARGEASRQVRLYVFMQCVSAILNNLLMLGFVTGLGMYSPLAKILQIGIVFIWNYTFCRLIVFAPQPTAENA